MATRSSLAAGANSLLIVDSGETAPADPTTMAVNAEIRATAPYRAAWISAWRPEPGAGGG